MNSIIKKIQGDLSKANAKSERLGRLKYSSSSEVMLFGGAARKGKGKWNDFSQSELHLGAWK